MWFKKKEKVSDKKEENLVDGEVLESTNDAPHDQGWLSRLTGGLSRSTGKISQGLSDFVTKRKLDDEALEVLEEVLIGADLGPQVAADLVAEFARERFGKDVEQQEIREALAAQVAGIVQPVARPFVVDQPEDGAPYVVIVCGVNGAGKTTTIGKLAERLMRDEGKRVMVAAGDTFRAAAVEQLAAWAHRSGALFHSKGEGADAAAVAYEAYEAAAREGVDVLLVDTAGRLHNKSNLMDELQKIVRVLRKKDEALPHACLLVLDATTGQNAISQVEVFSEMVDVSGLIVTKLDGSAKGGILVPLAQRFSVPVHAIGVGEGLDDLQAFDADDYARALMDLAG